MLTPTFVHQLSNTDLVWLLWGASCVLDTARMLTFLLVLLLAVRSIAITLPDSYDVVWTEPGVNQSADSMPVGGGDVGLNVWYEDGMNTSIACV